jgi:hypothetical protein
MIRAGLPCFRSSSSYVAVGLNCSVQLSYISCNIHFPPILFRELRPTMGGYEHYEGYSFGHYDRRHLSYGGLWGAMGPNTLPSPFSQSDRSAMATMSSMGGYVGLYSNFAFSWCTSSWKCLPFVMWWPTSKKGNFGDIRHFSWKFETHFL